MMTAWEEHVRDEGTRWDYYTEAYASELRDLEREAEMSDALAEEEWLASLPFEERHEELHWMSLLERTEVIR